MGVWSKFAVTVVFLMLFQMIFSIFAVFLMILMFLSVHRFRPVTVKSLIHDVLNEELTGKQYSSEECTKWSKTLSEAIKTRVKGQFLNMQETTLVLIVGVNRH